ncbi:MAG TPA: hypothetical protein VM223_07540 [Planctomycetota bacterium]|nr:hypothetical protein [Planctomycetota bacterium]
MAIGKNLMEALRKAASWGVRIVDFGGGTNAKRGAQRGMGRRMRRRNRKNRAPAMGLCPVDWRNPTGVGNRRLRAVAEHHGIKALRKVMKHEAKR